MDVYCVRLEMKYFYQIKDDKLITFTVFIVHKKNILYDIVNDLFVLKNIFFFRRFYIIRMEETENKKKNWCYRAKTLCCHIF